MAPGTPGAQKCLPLTILQIFLEPNYDQVISLLKFFQNIPGVLNSAVPIPGSCSCAAPSAWGTPLPSLILKADDPTHPPERCLHSMSLPTQTDS